MSRVLAFVPARQRLLPILVAAGALLLLVAALTLHDPATRSSDKAAPSVAPGRATTGDTVAGDGGSITPVAPTGGAGVTAKSSVARELTAPEATADDAVVDPAPGTTLDAPAIDRMADALLHTDVGPILDAADPMGRDSDHGAPGRTVGAMASRHDAYFEQRVHAAIYRGADRLARTSAALAAAAPAIAHSMHELRRSLREAERAWRDAYDGAADDGVPTDD